MNVPHYLTTSSTKYYKTLRLLMKYFWERDVDIGSFNLNSCVLKKNS